MTQLQMEYQKLQKDYANLEEQKRLHDAEIRQKTYENQKILADISKVFQDIAYSQVAMAAVPAQTTAQLLSSFGSALKGGSSLVKLFG